jgi:hypothetical protein
VLLVKKAKHVGNEKQVGELPMSRLGWEARASQVMPGLVDLVKETVL